MELEVYKKSDFYEDYIDSKKEYYERENADAYFAERLAEKDKEIASLKAQIAEAKELSIELQKRNKAIADNAIGNVEAYKSKCDAEIESLKAKLAEQEAESRRLKEMMPKYKQFIKDEKFKKELVDEYDGYVYEWMGHTYIATPYINIFIKGILRALWLARAKRAIAKQAYYDVLSRGISSERDEMYDAWNNVERKCLNKAEQYK